MSAILKESISHIAQLEETFIRIEGRSQYTMEKRIKTYLSRRNDEYFGKQMLSSICTTLVQGASWIMEEEYGEWTLSDPLRRGYNSRFYSPAPSRADFTYPTTLEDVREAIEEMFTEANREAVEEYDEDPEWFIEHGYNNPHKVHTWGDAVGAIRAWMNSDPFVIYCVGESLKEHGECMIEDYLVDMADGVDEGKELAVSVKDHFDSLMSKFQKSVTK